MCPAALYSDRKDVCVLLVKSFTMLADLMYRLCLIVTRSESISISHSYVSMSVCIVCVCVVCVTSCVSSPLTDFDC